MGWCREFYTSFETSFVNTFVELLPVTKPMIVTGYKLPMDHQPRTLYPTPMENRLRSREWRVEVIPLSTCAAMVCRYHYAGGGSNTATHRHGLIRNKSGRCWGIAWWIPPTKGAAKFVYPEGDPHEVLSLSRLVCHPSAPKNAASFLIGRSIRLIRQDPRWKCLVTYADEGYQGHKGAIYRATNWEYRGMTAPEAQWMTQGGIMVARKAGPKTRTKAEMEALGYEMRGRFSKHRFRMVL